MPQGTMSGWAQLTLFDVGMVTLVFSIYLALGRFPY